MAHEQATLGIERKFRMVWRFIALSVPEQASILPAHLYESERQQFVSLMEESRELAVISLREEFSSLVAHLVERLGENADEDKPKILRNGMFGRFSEFLENFNTRNIFQDDALTARMNRHMNNVNDSIDKEVPFLRGLKILLTGLIILILASIFNKYISKMHIIFFIIPYIMFVLGIIMCIATTKPSWRGYKISGAGFFLCFFIAIFTPDAHWIFVLIPWLMAVIGGIMHMCNFFKQLDEMPDR